MGLTRPRGVFRFLTTFPPKRMFSRKPHNFWNLRGFPVHCFSLGSLAKQFMHLKVFYPPPLGERWGSDSPNTRKETPALGFEVRKLAPAWVNFTLILTMMLLWHTFRVSPCQSVGRCRIMWERLHRPHIIAGTWCCMTHRWNHRGKSQSLFALRALCSYVWIVRN